MREKFFVRIVGAVAGLFIGTTFAYLVTGIYGEMAAIPPQGMDGFLIYGLAFGVSIFGFFYGRYLFTLVVAFMKNL